MSLFRYNVTRIRAAACCPRIHYFDAEEQRRRGLKTRPLTRIWTEGDDTPPGDGKTFHTIVERFNREAGKSADLASALVNAEVSTDIHRVLMRFLNTRCVDHEALREKPVSVRQSLIVALTEYTQGVTASIAAALSAGTNPNDVLNRLFGDIRRRVDATFHVGDDARVHVTGVIDYVYEDPATGRSRIVDYKLTPPTHPNKDLMQVMTYALMHHHQHGTRPDGLVYYLHPKQQKVEKLWEAMHRERHKVYDLLASMVLWEDYDEQGGRGFKPPGDRVYCSACKWRSQCEKRLGSKDDGDWDHRWQSLTDVAGGNDVAAPKSVAVQPPRAVDPAELQEGRVIEDPVRQHEGPEPGEGLLGFADTVLSPQRTDVVGPVGVEGEQAQESSTDGRLQLGTIANESTLVAIDLPVLNTHVAVVGAAGSGKTWMAKTIAEEAVLAGIPVIAIDPQGDLVQFLRARDPSEIAPEHRARYKRYWGRVEPRVYTPGSSHGIRLNLDPVRIPSEQDLAGISDARRREEELHGMLSSVASNLVALCKAGGEVDSQRNILFQLLRTMSSGGEISLRKIVAGLQEPDQFGINDADLIVKKTEREKLARKLHGFSRGPSAALFEGGIPLSIEDLRRPSQPERVPLNVIYLNALTDDDQKHFFVATLAAEIYRWMITSLEAGGARLNLLFYLDEARDYIPAGGKKPAAKEPLIRLFTQGRKYGVGCLLCTQSPRAVDYSVFGNCSTKVIGRMEAAQDVDRVAEWFSTSGAVPSWIAHRKGADRGSFVARWPGMPTQLSGKQFQTRMLYSAHEGAWSPDRLERELRAR